MIFEYRIQANKRKETRLHQHHRHLHPHHRNHLRRVVPEHGHVGTLPKYRSVHHGLLRQTIKNIP